MTDKTLLAAIERRTFLKYALATPCLLAGTAGLLRAEDVDPSIVEPTAEEIDRAIAAMNATSALKPTDERYQAAATLQRSVDRLRAGEFGKYFASTPEAAAETEKERGILRYLNVSFDRVLKELEETEVREGSVALWHVYNMGYIVKTPTQTFAIDVRHRRAPELVPHIEFLLVTHNHIDHYSHEMNAAMAAAGKPVVSNFIENDWHTPEDRAERTFGDVHIAMKRVDHNKSNLIGYVTTFEISCGPKSGDCLIYHVGDACDVNQLDPAKKVDIFIPHLAVGLNVPKAVNETIKPDVTLLSHILELGHLINKWRWSYQYGYNIVRKCENDSVILPVWGEKYLFERG